MSATPHKILIIRNDKLGDFMLAFPAFLMARASLADSQIHALVPEYTRELAEACTGIDRLIIDPGPHAGLKAQWQLFRQLRREKYTAVVTLFSTTRTGLLCWLAGIDYRLAPATKLAQIFYNHTLKQRRSRSAKPEFEYNLDLIRCFVAHMNQSAARLSPPYLQFNVTEIRQLRQRFEASHQIPAGQRLILIHPGSGGSANNLSPPQYAELARQLHVAGQTHFGITAGPGQRVTHQQVV
ncbi:MAG: glycosyltransferase family 9 protein [Gammaproteobacteria bacterium]